MQQQEADPLGLPFAPNVTSKQFANKVRASLVNLGTQLMQLDKPRKKSAVDEDEDEDDEDEDQSKPGRKTPMTPKKA